MKSLRTIVSASSAAALAVLFLAQSAAAHISLEQAGTHKSRYGDSLLKDGPCGKPGGTRGTNVYTYAPGETITIKLKEYIAHPSYFRIAFDQDGDDDFMDPVSIKPIDPARPCPFNGRDQCGQSDFDNSPAVLMDNLDPHLAGQHSADYSWQVTLPNVECDNCTLQIIQVMQDTIHGEYNLTVLPFPDLADIYHQCIDLVLTAGTSGTGTGGATSAGGTSSGAGGMTSGAGGETSSGAGGTSTSAGGSPTGSGSGGDGTTNSGSGGASAATGGAGNGEPSAAPASSGDEGGCAVKHGAHGTTAAAVASLGLLLVAKRRRRR